MEKKIDEICRMLRDYVKTGNSDVRLSGLLFELMHKICIEEYLANDEKKPHINYFIQSLGRELREPEVMNRQADGSSNFLEAEYEWEGP